MGNIVGAHCICARWALPNLESAPGRIYNPPLQARLWPFVNPSRSRDGVVVHEAALGEDLALILREAAAKEGNLAYLALVHQLGGKFLLAGLDSGAKAGT